MGLDDYFPASTWVWRRLKSRSVKFICLLLIGVVLFISASLHIRAVIFEHRITHIIYRLEQVHLDETSKSDLLALVPALRPCAVEDSPSPSDSCYELQLSESPFLGPLNYFGSYGYRTAYLLGMRYWDFSTTVRLRQDKVFQLGYNVSVNNGSLAAPWLTSVTVAEDAPPLVET
jgi:hypothetical protein